MKSLFAIVAAAFAVSALAQGVPTPTAPAAAPAKVEKKAAAPAKSEAPTVKDQKASVPAPK